MTVISGPGWYHEGKARFCADGAFYRSQSRIGRDLAVLAAAVYRKQRGELRVLDAMTGCGVRPLRYHLEANADWVWANEGNPDLGERLLQNLSSGMRSRAYRITHQDANQVFFSCYQQQDFYDLVDVDSFGGGAPYLHTGQWAVRLGGLLYLTSTDTRTTSGHNVDHSIKLYGACARVHPAAHEQGARLLIGSALQHAASRGMNIHPVFSLFNGHVHRVMVRLSLGESRLSRNYGFLGYCHHCGHYEVLSWKQLGRAVCPNSVPSSSGNALPLTVSGPMWLGPLHDRPMLVDMINLARTWDWQQPINLLDIMRAESELPPYYFPLAEIGRRGQMDIPKRDSLIRKLRDRGFLANRTHFDTQAIKTTATITECVTTARACPSN